MSFPGGRGVPSNLSQVPSRGTPVPGWRYPSPRQEGVPQFQAGEYPRTGVPPARQDWGTSTLSRTSQVYAPTQHRTGVPLLARTGLGYTPTQNWGTPTWDRLCLDRLQRRLLLKFRQTDKQT